MPTILITGASAGLGAEMARQFAALGHDVALAARRLDRLTELRSEIAARHPERRVEIRALDVTDDDAVFEVVHDVAADFGHLDRIIVNAGLGTGARLGTGRFDANRQTAMTNFIGALAQAEAAMEVFREQGYGHLVFISSVSAMRGMPRGLATYAASKAAVASLAEGLRSEMQATEGLDVTVSTLFPGYIRSEMNSSLDDAPFMVDTEAGVRAMVEAIEARRATAFVPWWPWRPLGAVIKRAPLAVVRRLF